MPARDTAGPFFFAIDHCFPIRGQGTVVTGTVLRGSCVVNDVVELPQLGLEKKVKSMQMFKRPVKSIECGDRAGLCLAQLDAQLIERGIVATPGSVPQFTAALARNRRACLLPLESLSLSLSETVVMCVCVRVKKTDARLSSRSLAFLSFCHRHRRWCARFGFSAGGPKRTQSST